MPEVISKCGMNCAACPWSPITRKGIPDEEFNDFRKQAKTIMGYTPTEKPCLLCLTPEDKIGKNAKHWHANFRRGCQIRKCVTKMDIKNCAYCSRFPCASEKAHAGATREDYEKRLGRSVTNDEYHTFIEPFEGLKRLERIRSTLKPEEIVEAITVPPLKMKVVEFPDTFSDQQSKVFKPVYTLLSNLKQSTLGVKDVDLPPQQFRLKKRVKHFFRFLWIFAAFSTHEETNGGFLVVDAETFHNNRGSETGLTTWSFLDQVITPTLKPYGIQVQLVDLNPNWKTPTGALRKSGWELNLTFTKKIGGLTSLKAFQMYGKKLLEKHEDRAFRYFSDVDMQPLTKT
ncbi:MAG: DUF3795 domain-containing protein [Candidatus Hodarchaeota archaeon]